MSSLAMDLSCLCKIFFTCITGYRWIWLLSLVCICVWLSGLWLRSMSSMLWTISSEFGRELRLCPHSPGNYIPAQMHSTSVLLSSTPLVSFCNFCFSRYVVVAMVIIYKTSYSAPAGSPCLQVSAASSAVIPRWWTLPASRHRGWTPSAFCLVVVADFRRTQLSAVGDTVLFRSLSVMSGTVFISTSRQHRHWPFCTVASRLISLGAAFHNFTLSCLAQEVTCHYGHMLIVLVIFTIYCLCMYFWYDFSFLQSVLHGLIIDMEMMDKFVLVPGMSFSCFAESGFCRCCRSLISMDITTHNVGVR